MIKSHLRKTLAKENANMVELMMSSSQIATNEGITVSLYGNSMKSR